MNEWWVIRRQPVGESDWLVDLFTRQFGRVRATASGRRYLPVLHQHCRGEWSEKSSRLQIRLAEGGQAHHLEGNALVCALYLEELIIRLLPERDPDATLYSLYSNALTALAEGLRADIWLRLFEQRLLSHCGYGFSWSIDSAGRPLADSGQYQFVPGEGFIAREDGYSGEVLRYIAAGEFQRPGALSTARSVLRQAIDALLLQPLISRELLI
ncbi:MAG: DNA repair protein RecO [Thalassolituus sp.]